MASLRAPGCPEQNIAEASHQVAESLDVTAPMDDITSPTARVLDRTQAAVPIDG